MSLPTPDASSFTRPTVFMSAQPSCRSASLKPNAAIADAIRGLRSAIMNFMTCAALSPKDIGIFHIPLQL